MSPIPIDRATLKQIRQALAALAEVKPLIDAALEAGFDVAEEAARASHYDGLAKSILRVYEPLVNKVQPVDS